MKTIEIDDELYQYIASQTQHIGEDASNILRRLLLITPKNENQIDSKQPKRVDSSPLVTLVNSEEFLNEKKLVNRFLSILSILYSCNESMFSVAAASIHGSKRRYMAKDEETLLRSGNNTKPKQIPNTPYLVVTNSNTARKVSIIELIMSNMNITDDVISHVKTQFVLK